MNGSGHDHMQAPADVLHARVRRDAYNDQVIEGRRGNIHADGNGYSVAVMLASARTWNVAKLTLQGFCELRQNGDTEGVLHLPKLPTPEQAAVLRKLLRIRKRPALTVETVERLRKQAAFLKPRPAAEKQAG